MRLDRLLALAALTLAVTSLPRLAAADPVPLAAPGYPAPAAARLPAAGLPVTALPPTAIPPAAPPAPVVSSAPAGCAAPAAPCAAPAPTPCQVTRCPACATAAPQTCVRVPEKVTHTHTAYRCETKTICLPTCGACQKAAACGDCAAAECGKPRLIRLLFKRFKKEECEELKCKPQAAPCSTPCSSCGGAANWPAPGAVITGTPVPAPAPSPAHAPALLPSTPAPGAPPTLPALPAYAAPQALPSLPSIPATPVAPATPPAPPTMPKVASQPSL